MGTVAGGDSFLAPQKPYLIIEVPRQSLPEKYAHHYGRPCNIYKNLNDLVGKGFTSVEKVYLENFTATDVEKAEIENLLIGGVIL